MLRTPAIIVDLSISTYSSVSFLLHVFLLFAVTQKHTKDCCNFWENPLLYCQVKPSLTPMLFLFSNRFCLGFTQPLLLLISSEMVYLSLPHLFLVYIIILKNRLLKILLLVANFVQCVLIIFTLPQLLPHPPTLCYTLKLCPLKK